MPIQDVKPPQKPTPESPKEQTVKQPDTTQSSVKKSKFKFLKILLVLLILGAMVAAVLAYIHYKNAPDPQTIKDAAARAQEIKRVSLVAEKQTNDKSAQAIATTTEATISGQETGLTNYMRSQKINFTPADLAVYQDKTVDAKLDLAVQQKTLEQTYYQYLKTNVLAYRAALKIATGDMNQQGKNLIKIYLPETQKILDSPQLQTSQ